MSLLVRRPSHVHLICSKVSIAISEVEIIEFCSCPFESSDSRRLSGTIGFTFTPPAAAGGFLLQLVCTVQ